MGISLYLKNYTDSQGKSQLEIKARSRGQHFSKSLFKINRLDWNPKLQRINATSALASKYNPQLAEIKENMYNSYELYEANIYSFEELCRRLNGGSSKLDMIGFAEDVYKDYKDVSFKNILAALRGWKKVLGTDSLLFTDMTYTSITAVVSKMKLTHKPASINTYLGILSSVTNEAYRRGIVNEKFVPYRQYYQKVRLKQATVVTTDEFREAISKVKTIYQFQCLAFWLLSFCTRGLYQMDICKLHLNKLQNEDDSSNKRYTLHNRSKTGEPMQILISLNPIEELISTIQQSIVHTHKIDTRGTFQIFDYDLSDWNTHKNLHSVYGINLRQLLKKPLKSSRKTFESIAVALDISSAIRYQLLGHADSSIKKHYIQFKWSTLVDKVDDAHEQILKEFQASELWELLANKYYNEIKPDDQRGAVYIGNTDK